MLVERMTYETFDGREITEDFHFNITDAEITEMQLTTPGGLKAEIERIIDSKDQVEIINTFKSLILKCYGKKSPDGKRFIKSKEITDEFVQTNAYSQLFMKLAFDSKAAARFINGVIPAKLRSEIEKEETEETEETEEDVQNDIVKNTSQPVVTPVNN